MIRRIRSVLILLCSAMAVFVVQASLIPYIEVAGIKPNLPLALVVIWSFLLGERPGMLVGLFMGLVCDLAFGPYLGLCGMLYAAMGFLAGKLQRQLFASSLSFPVFLTFAGDLVFCGLYYLLQFSRRLSLLSFALSFALPEALYTAAFAVLLYPALSALYRRFIYVRPNQVLQQEAGRTNPWGW